MARKISNLRSKFSNLNLIIIFSCILIFASQIGQVMAYRIVDIQQPDELLREFDWRNILTEIQQNLKMLGFYRGPINGRYDAATRNAVDQYRRQHGILNQETIWPSVLVHMRALGEALLMQKSLKTTRIRQIDRAKSRLLEHSASREFILSPPDPKTADPTHDSSVCFAAPTLRCLLDETIESIRGISRNEYRNWALQDLIRVLAFGGMIDEMKQEIRHLTDARLVIVALRESVESMVSGGHMKAAEDTLVYLPQSIDRLQSILTSVRGWIRIGQLEKAKDLMKLFNVELLELKEIEETVELRAESAVIYFQLGAKKKAGQILSSLVAEFLDGEDAPDGYMISAFSTAYARIGDLERAESLLKKNSQSGKLRRGWKALIMAHTGSGNTEAAVDAAQRIPLPRYRVIAQCNAARKHIKNKNFEGSRRFLIAAEISLKNTMGKFAKNFGRSCLAEAYAAHRDFQVSRNFLKEIDIADMKARSLWRIWGMASKFEKSESNAFENAAKEATDAADTFTRVLIWSQAALIAGTAGRSELMEKNLRHAIEVVKLMKMRWRRARALSRIAKTIVSLEAAGLR